ncbi:uncharacterized protein BO66DRAFT_192788 [Aspergillus aculeatinus CBS 121060]|uniref:Uncharacterized protein n=1 Tax=Aspergillus aculeatinus CBS 121060 TaxID=1448322 RepID=A0ACD1GXI9_9EURO|nr:hypothetical protein BO66DRAFT_192788 [Aspergillus aculeatinus CBS 121060]RAH66003.1 hypothetical protein BO66DRAFT_192788 [Aspergillus aculeatinus CBS 121060]
MLLLILLLSLHTTAHTLCSLWPVCIRGKRTCGREGRVVNLLPIFVLACFFFLSHSHRGLIDPRFSPSQTKR